MPRKGRQAIAFLFRDLPLSLAAFVKRQYVIRRLVPFILGHYLSRTNATGIPTLPASGASNCSCSSTVHVQLAAGLADEFINFLHDRID